MSSGYRARRIPVNVTDSGRCFNGLFRTRNVIEGLILAAGPALLVGFFFNPAELTLKIQVLTVAAGLPLVAGVFGVPPYSLVEFLSLFIRYSKEKHYAKYNPRLKWETKPEYLIHGYEEPFTKTLMNALDLLLNASYSFSVPSLPEQRKIADLLSAVDDVITTQEAEVAAWEKRKKGVMQKLFSQEVRFKADDGSDFPDWEEQKIEDVCVLNPRTEQLDDEFYYMDLGSIDHGRWEAPEIVNKVDAPSRAQRVAAIDDVFFQSVRPYNMGHYHYVAAKDKQVVASTGYIQARMRNGSNAFLYQLFYEERFNAEVNARCTGSNYPAINSRKFGEITVALPSLPEQRKIADCLSALDDVIIKAKNELAKWQELKKGLLQQMFV